MKDLTLVEDAFKRLDAFVNSQNFKGWDLFDGLNSQLFKRSVLYRSKWLRLAWIQIFKHSPVNLRLPARVPKGYNDKGLGLFASGLIRSGRVAEAGWLLDLLQEKRCDGFHGSSWGYNFDWQARAFYVPEGKPNMVTSVFVANAFLDHFDVVSEEESLKAAEETCDFILHHLIQHEDSDSLCFAYIPGETARVHNANMLGAALLARVYSHTKKEELLEKSRKAMAYSMAGMNPDCSWPYGERHHHGFIDNFHTGFNLVALKSWMDHTGEKHWENKLLGAYRYFVNTFWLDNGCPKYYHDSLYPVDIHCSAQGVVTCLSFADYLPESLVLAEKILLWAIDHMMDGKGFFYHQKTKFYTNKIPYIRWSQAWMFYAMALYLNHMNHNSEE